MTTPELKPTALTMECVPGTRSRGTSHGRALAALRGYAVLILALLWAGLAGVASGQVVTEFPITTAASYPVGITAGPDGNLWFTEGSAATRSAGSPRPASSPSSPSPRPTAGLSIAAGPDGNLWFTETSGNKIGRITTAGVITEFSVPTATAALDIAAGPDGNLWFTEGGYGFLVPNTNRTNHHGWRRHRVPDPHRSLRPCQASRRARTATSGSPNGGYCPDAKSGGSPRPASSPSSRSLPPAASPRGIAAGPDGNLWFTETRQLATRSGGSRRPASSRSSPFPRPAATLSVSPPARTATSGSPNTYANQIGRITTGRRRHRIPHSDGRQRPCRDHRRPGRQPLVHRIRCQPDRADHPRSNYTTAHGGRRPCRHRHQLKRQWCA